MKHAELATRFEALHVKGNPVILYNIWDAASARAVQAAGAHALATGSASVAGAHGYPDGQAIPLDFVERIVTRIAASVELPLSVDMEGGYATEPGQVAATAARLIDAGAVGCNFEDQIVEGEGIYDTETQCRRIAAIRAAAEAKGIAFVLNARTDLFLQQPDEALHKDLLPEAIHRAQAYAAAGASCFFVPWLVDEQLIAGLCRAIDLPVNVMMRAGAPATSRLAELGVARISYGPGPFATLMKTLTDQATAALAPAR